MTKKLWLALVEHESVPGTVPYFFYMENEPSDPFVKRRTGYSPKSELSVVGMFDITHALIHDRESLVAVHAAIANFVYP